MYISGQMQDAAIIDDKDTLDKTPTQIEQYDVSRDYQVDALQQGAAAQVPSPEDNTLGKPQNKTTPAR